VAKRRRTGTIIQTRRDERRLNVYRLARAAGIAASTLTKIEQRKRHPSLRTAIKIAHVLRCCIDEIFDNAGYARLDPLLSPPPTEPAKRGRVASNADPRN